MVGISSSIDDATAPHSLAFKLSSVILFAAVAGMMLITSKIQPSQLAEEQWNVTRLWKQLRRLIETALSLRSPIQRDVEVAMEKMLALEKAYPLPLLPRMLEKFLETVEPARWWPKLQPRPQQAADQKHAKSNGWIKELEEEMRGVPRVLKVKDEEQYIRLGKLVLNTNKILATSRPLLADLATVSSGFIGSLALLGITGGVLAIAANTMEHGGQVGMVFKLFRNYVEFYRLLKEEIEFNLGEKDVERREDRDLLEMKMTLQLGRNLSELKGLATYASPSCDDEDIKEFSGNCFD